MAWSRKAQLAGFYTYVARYSVTFACVAGVAIALKDKPSVIDAITACKIGSLVSILRVNGEIAKQIDRSRGSVRKANHLILAVVALLIILLTAKFVWGYDHGAGLIPPWRSALHAIYHHLWWLSAFPLVAYAGLNWYIAYMRPGSHRERTGALRVFVFVDVICVAPLLVVLLFLYFFSRYLHETSNMEVFTSGAMAVVLLASSFATKAVDVLFSD
jgi:hypothetical protein